MTGAERNEKIREYLGLAEAARGVGDHLAASSYTQMARDLSSANPLYVRAPATSVCVVCDGLDPLECVRCNPEHPGH